MKKPILTALSLLMLMGTAHVEAQSLSSFFKTKPSKGCSAVDLRSEALGEVRNQGNAGWCFAYTTADLVSHRLNKKISATDMAINFYYQMPEMPKTDLLSNANGGSDMGSMSYTKNNYCPEEVMPSSEFIPANCVTTGKRIEALDVVRIIEKFDRASVSELTTCQISLIQALYKNTSEMNIKTVLGDTTLSSFMKINELREINCRGKRIKPATNLAMKSGLRSGADSIKDINDQLDKNNPVSLNYDAHFLMDRPRTIGSVDNHYSSIVGRRLNEKTNTCQYLIRNSWGKDCSIYPAPYKTQCEDGNIWVDENVLGQNILGVHFIK